MATERDRNRNYDVHGDGIETLREGLADVGVPDHRRAAALEIVQEVLQANGAVDFRWYRTAGKDEVCCYWDDLEKNVLWVARGEVHIRASDPLERPDRPIDWRGRDGDQVGWALPGLDSTDRDRQRRKTTDEVTCPVTFIKQPAGSTCPECEVVHEPADA